MLKLSQVTALHFLDSKAMTVSFREGDADTEKLSNFPSVALHQSSTVLVQGKLLKFKRA